jgi:hypothetical protein
MVMTWITTMMVIFMLVVVLLRLYIIVHFLLFWVNLISLRVSSLLVYFGCFIIMMKVVLLKLLFNRLGVLGFDNILRFVMVFRISHVVIFINEFILTQIVSDFPISWFFFFFIITFLHLRHVHLVVADILVSMSPWTSTFSISFFGVSVWLTLRLNHILNRRVSVNIFLDQLVLTNYLIWKRSLIMNLVWRELLLELEEWVEFFMRVWSEKELILEVRRMRKHLFIL